MTVSGATVVEKAIPHPLTGERVLVLVRMVPPAEAKGEDPCALRRRRDAERRKRARVEAARRGT